MDRNVSQYSKFKLLFWNSTDVLEFGRQIRLAAYRHIGFITGLALSLWMVK